MSITLPAASTIPSRTTGVAPLAVFFDATATTGTETTLPFHELHYRWNFGDSSAGTWSTSGKSKNIAKGPIAAHVFETAGTFTWTLWVKDSTGTIESTSGQITVTAANTQFTGTKTICFTTGTNFDGKPDGAEEVPNATWADVISHIAADRRLLLKRGDSWSTSAAATTLPSSGPGIIGAFGSGNKPIVNQSSTSNGLFVYYESVSDWRLMDLDLRGPAGISSENCINGGGTSTQSRTLALRLDISYFVRGFSFDYATYDHAENFIVDCTFSHIGITGNTPIYFGGTKSAILGVSIPGLDGNLAHLIRTWHLIKCVIQHNLIENPGTGMCGIKLHNEIDASPPDSEYIILSNNKMKGGGGCAIALGPQHAAADETVKNIIVERNNLRTKASEYPLIEICGPNITARNNLLISSGVGTYYIGINVYEKYSGVIPDKANIYNNTFYQSDDGSEFVGIRLQSTVTNAVVRNNVGCTPSFTGYQEEILNDEATGTTKSNNYQVENKNDFVDADNENFHLVSGSSLRDGGYTVPVFNDYDEYSRPVNSLWDVGAFEYGSTDEDGEPPVAQPSIDRVLIYLA